MFKYYHPLEESHKATKHSASASAIQASHDQSLTAFAQLGALRLDCRRVLISLLDRRYQYVIAEATKTLSLNKDTVSDKEDQLCFGVNQFERFGTACCEHAAGLVPALLEAGERITGDACPVLVVPDLREDVRFAQEPYVTCKPFGRFYAGAPIISPANLVIGAYCVLDDKPRVGGLTAAEIEFVQDMTVTVMAHLEMNRVKVELCRCQNMVAGLGNFIDGRSTNSEWIGTEMVSSNTRTDQTHSPSPSGKTSDESADARLKSKTRKSARKPHVSVQPGDSDGRSQPVQATSNQAENVSHSIRSENDRARLALDPTVAPGPDATARDRNALQEESISLDIRNTFGRAAETVRNRVGLDGAVFLDASIGTFGVPVDRPWAARKSDSDANADDARESAQAKGNHCLCLGRSMADRASNTRTGAQQPMSVPERLLNALLTRYPRGKIWNYDDDEEEVATSSTSDDFTNHPEGINRKGQRWKERKLLQTLIPGVRSLAFIGMWDSHREVNMTSLVREYCNLTDDTLPALLCRRLSLDL